jgi:hypothetical protein
MLLFRYANLLKILLRLPKKPNKLNEIEGQNMKRHDQIAIAIVTLFALPMVVQALPTPPSVVPEPSTYYAGAICLVPLAVGVIRALRKSRK